MKAFARAQRSILLALAIRTSVATLRSAMSKTRRLLMGPAVYLALAGIVQAQGATGRSTATHDDYVRAVSLLPPALYPKLRNAQAIPHWIGDRDDFWYRRETRDGHEFIRVDAATGSKRPAFDHQALAVELTTVRGLQAEPGHLPFDDFVYENQGTSIKFNVDGKEYRCTLRSPKCDLIPLSGVSPELLVSPDGRNAVLTRNGNLWLRQMNGGIDRALTADGEQDFGYGIWPDAWQGGYIPRERQATPLPPLKSYWSPDSRHVVVSRIDQRHVEPYPFLESAPRDGSFRPKVHAIRLPLAGEKPATLDWFVFDIPSGKARRLEFPYAKLLVMQADLMPIRKTWWSKNNRHLYAVAFGDNMESAYLFDADIETGQVRTVIEETATPRVDLNSTSYNPPNVQVVGGGAEVIWFSQRDGWGHLYLYDVATGRLKNRITTGAWLVRDIVHVDEESRRIYFTGSGREPGNPYYRYLYRVNFDGSNLKLLSPESGDHLLTSSWNDVVAFDGALSYEPVSPSGAYVVYTNAPIDQPPQTYIRATTNGGIVSVLEKADATDLFAAGFRPPEEFVVKAADGRTDLYGVVYKPPHFDQAKKYAVVDAQYASPLTAVVPRNFVQALRGAPIHGSSHALAELGFIVVTVDARGTAYRSRDFSQWGYGHLNTIGLEDHIAALRQLAKRNPGMDLDRVGIIGGSYGGWSSLRGMLEFPDFFKVGVAAVPPGSMHNMTLDYHFTAFQGRPLYSDGGEVRPTPTEVPRNWQITDGRQQADRLVGKLLIVMGELDENVLPGSTLQLMNAFIKQNKDFELIYLPDTNHGDSGSPYVVRRMWDFLVRHLQGVEPPTDFKIVVTEESLF